MSEMIMTIINDEDGQGMVEYGLIIAGIAIAAIAAIFLLGPMISNMFTNVGNKLA